MRRARKPGAAGYMREEKGLRKSHAKTHSVPRPRRRLHRGRHNVSITTRGRIVGGLWHPKLIAASGRFGIQTDTRTQSLSPGALIAPGREASRWQQTGPIPTPDFTELPGIELGAECTVRCADRRLLQAGFVARTTKPATGAPASLRSSADSASAVSRDWVSTRFTYARLWL
jgi:hypothetical protein